MSEKITASKLKEICVLYEGDIFDLACLILKIHQAKDEGTNSISHHTINGLFRDYVMLTGLNSDKVLDVAKQHGLPLGAIVISDWEESHPR